MEHFLSTRPRVCFEVEKIIGVSSDGNVRTYQVQWAPAWVSSFHLIGCEHLIQEFLHKESQVSQEVSSSPSLANMLCGSGPKDDATAAVNKRNLAARPHSNGVATNGVETVCKKPRTRSTTKLKETVVSSSVQKELASALPEENENHSMQSNGDEISPISEISDRPNIFDLFETQESDATTVVMPEAKFDSSRINGNEIVSGHRMEQPFDSSTLQPSQMHLRELDHRVRDTGQNSNTNQAELPSQAGSSGEVSVKTEDEERMSDDFPDHENCTGMTRSIKVEMISPDSSATRRRGRPLGRKTKRRRGFPEGKSYHLVRQKVKEIRESVAELAAGGKYCAAFEKAVASADLSLLLFLCRLVKPIEVFRGGTNSYLSQSTLLKVVQQLSVDLKEDTKTKVIYLQECISHLDKKDEMTREHISMVLDFLTGQLYETIDGMTRDNPTDELLEPLSLLLRTTRTMLSRCLR